MANCPTCNIELDENNKCTECGYEAPADNVETAMPENESMDDGDEEMPA